MVELCEERNNTGKEHGTVASCSVSDLSES